MIAPTNVQIDQSGDGTRIKRPRALSRPSNIRVQRSSNRMLRQRSNGLFPLPLARLCRSDKCVFVVGIHDAGVVSDIPHF